MSTQLESLSISPALSERLLEVALSRGGDFAEVYVESSRFTHLVLTNQNIHEASPGLDCGAGIRVTDGEFSAYVYTSDLTEKGLMEAAQAASHAIQQKDSTPVQKLHVTQPEIVNPIRISPLGVSIQEKLALTKRFGDLAFQESDRVTTVRAFYSDLEQDVLIANSTGMYTTDSRNRIRTYMQVVVDGNEQRRLAYGPSASSGYEFFLENDFDQNVRQLVHNVIQLQEAEPAPTGEMPVIIGAGSGGILFHEACGHCLEAEAVANRQSVFGMHQRGQRIGSEELTVIDDGTLANLYGSQNVDDEGHPTRRNVLVENGILKNFLVDSFNGRKMGLEENGCSRRQSFRYAPTSRMSNTIIAPGTHSLEEMLAGVEYGLYAKRIDNGLIDTNTGNFVFPVTIGYLIKNGKIDKQVVGAQIAGNAAQVLMNIQMVGRQEEFDWSNAICKAKSGVIPVTFGLPPVLVNKMRVRRG